jgi:hypothetical protein
MGNSLREKSARLLKLHDSEYTAEHLWGTKVRTRLVEKMCKDLVEASHKLAVCSAASGATGPQGQILSEKCFEASEILSGTHSMFLAIRVDAKQFVAGFTSADEQLMAKMSSGVICAILTKIAADLSQD